MRAMKWILFVGLTISSLTNILEGILPPFYQSATEIESLLQNQDLSKLLPAGEPILVIQKNDQGYLISTHSHQVQAVITYQPLIRPGPAKFTVEFQEVEKQ